jgi:uncharacterized protein YjiS (DUF1127 family)
MHTIRPKSLPIWPTRGPRRAGPRFGGSFGSVAQYAADILLTWQERAVQRHALASLEPRMLDDIGLSRADAWREASKPFWRA